MFAPFRWPVRVYFEDTDAGGVVYYSNYLKFYERARTEWLRSVGISQQSLRAEQKILFLVKNISVDYKYSAVLDDELIVTTKILQLKGASIFFEQTISRENRELSTCKVKIACVGENSKRPLPIPDDILKKIQA